METSIVDKHLKELLAKLDNKISAADDGWRRSFDLKTLIRCYAHDVNMELALGLHSQTQ